MTRNKAAKAVAFGRRWMITRLEKGYGIGTPCRRLGSDSDKGIIKKMVNKEKKEGVETLPGARMTHAPPHF